MDPELYAQAFGGNWQPTSSLICSGEGDGDGGGGGSGDGEGGGDGETKLTENQLKQVSNVVNQALSKRMGSQSFKDSIGTAAGEAAASAITNAMPGILEEIGKVKPKSSEGDKGGGDGGWKDSEEYKQSMKREEARDAKIANIEAERKTEIEEKNRRQERDVLSIALKKHGVPDTRLRGAMSMLYSDDKVIRRDDDGNIRYVKQEEWGEELVDVDKGVADFLKTDEGLSYLPPTGARGTGNRGGKAKGAHATNATQKPTKEEAENQLVSWIDNLG